MLTLSNQILAKNDYAKSCLSNEICSAAHRGDLEQVRLLSNILCKDDIHGVFSAECLMSDTGNTVVSGFFVYRLTIGLEKAMGSEHFNPTQALPIAFIHHI